MSADLLAQVQDFLFHESDLLDRQAWREWLELFHPEGVYWVPSVHGQTDAEQVPSLMHEDKALLSMRIGRLEHPAAHGLAKPVRASRLLGNVRIHRVDDAFVEVRSKFVMLEWQDSRSRLFGGELTHRLSRQGTLKILEKRVDLYDVEAAFESIQIPF